MGLALEGFALVEFILMECEPQWSVHVEEAYGGGFVAQVPVLGGFVCGRTVPQLLVRVRRLIRERLRAGVVRGVMEPLVPPEGRSFTVRVEPYESVID